VPEKRSRLKLRANEIASGRNRHSREADALFACSPSARRQIRISRACRVYVRGLPINFLMVCARNYCRSTRHSFIPPRLATSTEIRGVLSRFEDVDLSVAKKSSARKLPLTVPIGPPVARLLRICHR
jgi:hypothetical protein